MARLLALAAAVLPASDALRASGALRDITESHPHGPTRQSLGNVQDLQYFGDMTIGVERLRAILDTGSFEILTFSTHCRTCGRAGQYDQEGSRSWKKGKISKVHAYGSGSCTAMDGYDSVSIADMNIKKQALWVANDCKIPLLNRAVFNAIAGLGPPGQPVASAERELKSLQDMETRFRIQEEPVPQDLQMQILATERGLEAAKSKVDMLTSMNVNTFSVCLGRQPGSPGYLIWNDHKRDGTRGVERLPVAGKITWSVQVQDFGLHQHGHDWPVACEDGCGAIVDTGTSLMAVPSPLYKAFMAKVTGLGVGMDCSDLSHFPDMVLTIDGRQLRFPPSTYLGSFLGQMTTETRGYVHLEQIGEGNNPCQLLLMDLGAPRATPSGPLIILGMPFFREYYTTFDLGSGPEDRSISIAPAGDNCEPEVDGLVSSDRQRASARYTPRSVNVSALRTPHWIDQSRSDGEVLF